MEMGSSAGVNSVLLKTKVEPAQQPIICAKQIVFDPLLVSAASKHCHCTQSATNCYCRYNSSDIGCTCTISVRLSACSASSTLYSLNIVYPPNSSQSIAEIRILQTASCSYPSYQVSTSTTVLYQHMLWPNYVCK